MSSTERRANEPARNPPLSVARATLAVARKELVTSFRDRQTTLYMVVLPIALYPLLFFLMIQGALLIQGRREHTRVRLAVVHDERAPLPEGLFEALESDPRPAADLTGKEELATRREIN